MQPIHIHDCDVLLNSDCKWVANQEGFYFFDATVDDSFNNWRPTEKTKKSEKVDSALF